MLVESQPKIFYFTDHYKRLSDGADPAVEGQSAPTVEPLLRRHWRTLASKKASASIEIVSDGQRRVCAVPPTVYCVDESDGGHAAALPTLRTTA